MAADHNRFKASAPFLILCALIAGLGGYLIVKINHIDTYVQSAEQEHELREAVEHFERNLGVYVHNQASDQLLGEAELAQLKTFLSQVPTARHYLSHAEPAPAQQRTIEQRLEQNGDHVVSLIDSGQGMLEQLTIRAVLQEMMEDISQLEGVLLTSQRDSLADLADTQSPSNVVFFVTLVAVLVVLLLENLFAGRIRRHLITLRESLLQLNQNRLNFDSRVNLDLQAYESIFYPLPKIAHLYNSFLEKHKEIHQKIKSSAVNCENTSMLVKNCHKELYEGTRVQANATDETSTSILEMTATLNEIGTSVEGLTRSTQESSLSIQGMDRSIHQISAESDELLELAKNSSSSIHDMVYAIGKIRESLISLSTSVESTTASTAQFNDSIKEIEGLAKESAALSQKSIIDTSAEGVKAVEKTISAMCRIKETVEQTEGLVSTLSNRSEEIGDILGVIDEVAERTNLLALNAAIIASQAGEHGKAFSVVASEIKNLAEKTTASIDEIENVISNVQSETKTVSRAIRQNVQQVQEGVTVSEKIQSVLERILKQSQLAGEMSWKIESAAIGQVKSVEQGNREIQNINQRVRQITAAVEEQDKGGIIIEEMLQKLSEFAHGLRKAMEEESRGSGKIAGEIEKAFREIKEINRAIQEHRKGSELMARSIGRIQVITDENIHLTDDLNMAVSTLTLHNEELQKEVRSFHVAEKAKTLCIGISPLVSDVKMQIRFTPLAHYLEKKLQMRVVLKVAGDLDAAVQDLGTGQTDIAFLTPSTYLDAKRRYGCEVFLKGVRDNQPFYHSAIAVREGSPIHSIADLKGKRFAFGDKKSTSGYLVPRAMLRREGIELEDLREHKFLSHHDRVAWAIVNGDVDAGGLLDSLARKFSAKGLKILKTSEPIPEFNFCCHPNVNTDLRNKIADALLELNDAKVEDENILKAIDAEYSGFMPATEHDYAGIEDLLDDSVQQIA
jgi:phosphate/phosphite/phosphonate ABC transporter binding protein